MITYQKEYYVLLLYIFFGCFFFSISFSGSGYLDILLSIVNNKIFLTIFFFPTFIFLWHLVIEYMNMDDMLLLRTADRKQYTIKILLQLLYATLLLYFQFFIILLICTNLTENTGFNISYHLSYNTNDLVVLVSCFARTLLNLIVFGLFNYYLNIQTKKRKTQTTIIFIVLMVIYFSGRFYPLNNTILDIFNLGFQMYGVALCNNIGYFIFSNLVFVLTIAPICLFLIFKKTTKVDFGI